MRIRTQVLALSVVAAACAAPPSADSGQASSSSQDESASAREGASDQRLVFDWQPPCKIPTKETLEAGGDALEIAFVLRVAPSKEPDSLELHFDDVKLLSANGKPIPEADASMAAAGVQAPAVVMSKDGTRARLLDPEAHLASAAALAFPRELREDPAARPAIEYRALERWRVYVGFWAGLSTTARTRKLMMPQLDGSSSEILYAIDAASAGPPRWQMKARIADEGSEAARAALIRLLADAVKASGGKTAPEVTRFEDRYQIDVEASYRVREVQHRSDIVMQVSGREVEQHKKRSASFDWSAATGCDRKAP